MEVLRGAKTVAQTHTKFTRVVHALRRGLAGPTFPRVRTNRLYLFLHEWRQRGWVETGMVFDGESARRGYRLTDIESFQLHAKSIR